MKELNFCGKKKFKFSFKNGDFLELKDFSHFKISFDRNSLQITQNGLEKKMQVVKEENLELKLSFNQNNVIFYYKGINSRWKEFFIFLKRKVKKKEKIFFTFVELFSFGLYFKNG